jgi:hypothetical protein
MTKIAGSGSGFTPKCHGSGTLDLSKILLFGFVRYIMNVKEPMNLLKVVNVIPGILDRTGQGNRAILLLLLPILPVFFEWLNIKEYQLPNLAKPLSQVRSKYF